MTWELSEEEKQHLASIFAMTSDRLLGRSTEDKATYIENLRTECDRLEGDKEGSF